MIHLKYSLYEKDYINDSLYPRITYIDETKKIYVKKEGIKTSESVSGDIILSKNNGKKIIIHISDYNLNDYPKDSFTPIGVVVIPASHNVYGDGSCGVMSLVGMDVSNPFNGDKRILTASTTLIDDGSMEDLKFAYGTANVSEYLNEYRYVMIMDNDVLSTTDIAYLPINGIYYSTPYAVNPYNFDDSRNENYYTTSITSGNMFSDFNGEYNSNVFLQFHTLDDLSTATTITNKSLENTAPAAACCYLYHTVGTSKGDWYIPSMGELCYLPPKLNIINNSLEKINEIYGSIITVNLSDNERYWSSTVRDGNKMNVLAFREKTTEYFSRGGYDFYVRAFTKIK